MKIEFDFDAVEADLASAEVAVAVAREAVRAASKGCHCAIAHLRDVEFEPTNTFGSAQRKVDAETQANLKCFKAERVAYAAEGALDAAELRLAISRAALSARDGLRAHYLYASGKMTFEVEI